MRLFVTLCFSFLPIISTFAKRAPRIAVIGGGIGGTSCAYFLKKLFQDETEIVLFERDIIGGRLSLLNVDGDYYEAGGSVIHPRNKYMVEFSKLLGLSLRKPVSSPFGIYNGKKFVFQESEWHFITIAKFLWRYGFSALSLFKQVQSILNEFDRIYDLQEKEFAFTTLSGLLEGMSPSFRNMTQESLSSLLPQKIYSKLFLEELVQSVMMVNYGQTNDISGFAGFVSLAGADNNLWSIHGGNKLAPEGILALSKATVKNGDVSEVVLKSDGTFNLSFNDISSNQSLSTEQYDIVVIASPMIKNSKNIKFTNFKKDFTEFQSTFHRTVSTFVQGKLNSSAFNENNIPGEILTFKNSLIFNSLSKVTPVSDVQHKDKKSVYKVFSQKPLTDENINFLFRDVDAVKVKDWLAYPHYKPPENLPPFMLYPGLYYTNAIELAASAMEMSTIAGKNVALLAYNAWHNLEHKIDHLNKLNKDEL